ncbi:phage holin family protein [Acetivibrio sp. MSJd-27]|uniref:phage holin family protein n=1 Tax=Acetivibrio sp. MSJd-27 TaxID=2841523 RepID=UPI001C124A7D|nr:phage holin family protein [Acetivibrio sp. MSJd-27]MBU5449162.1 phage holin family protein [Acetivibrio sp. MSJd-27]
MYELIQQYLKPELLVLIPVLYFIGMAIKKSSISDNFIPLLLGAFGILLSVIYLIATVDVNTYKDVAIMIFTGITQGILLAGGSVYVNQVIKQSSKNDEG